VGGVTAPVPDGDPVLERRERIARLVSLGQRTGWLAFGVAMVVFLVGLALGFPGWAATVVVVALVVGSLVLAPAIVFGYAVKAAEREDREQGR
jgi:O-antigen ligase